MRCQFNDQPRNVGTDSRPGMLPYLLSLALLPFGPGSLDAADLPAPAAHKVEFIKEVQPIFADRCYSCHGPEKQKGNLRWDKRQSALAGGDNGPAILVGKSAESLLIKLVSGLDPDNLMPPKGEPLTTAQIGLLRAWIDQGAEWPESASASAKDKSKHWAFLAPVRPPVPAVKQKALVRNPIDSFIVAKLGEQKLKPAREADRTTLLRRASLDLIGLPPTPQEVAKFVRNQSPDAWEREVERLLASPHYGERWGRHWLDAARYADTNGYEKDRPRPIWPYRDWVIRALNRDLPYDQFLTEQIAGDLVPNSSLEQHVATGFMRNSMLNQEGGTEPEQFRVEALFDRIDTLGKSVMGLTFNCAQCHNHKYDPFSQKEYYQLYAFINQDDEAFAEVPTAAEQNARDEILARIRRLEEEAMTSATNLAERMAEWESSLERAEGDWTTLDPVDWFNFGGKFEELEDHSLLAGGDLQSGDVMRVTVATPLTNISGFRLEALLNPNLKYGGPGTVGKGSFMVREFVVEAQPLDASVTNKVKFSRALASAEAPGLSVTNAIDGSTDKAGWCPAVTPERRNQSHRAVFECAEAVGFPGGTRLVFTIHQTFKPDKNQAGIDEDSRQECNLIGCLRLSATTNAAPLRVDPLSSTQRIAFQKPRNQRTPEDRLDLFRAFRSAQPEFANLNQNISNAWNNWPYPATTMVLAKRERARVTHLFKRGDRLRPGEELQAQVPAFLHPLAPDAPRNRLGLAKWMTDPRSPTTARVMVNRIWQIYFGQGLVISPEDFGTRVEMPSHPELLDWLACEFMEPKTSSTPLLVETLQPWSIKHIHRLILNSATYRQSSVVTDHLREKDPYNRFLARAPRLRVEGEVVQDIALSASGLLNRNIGGPSIYPPIPASVGDTSYGGFSWPETKGEDRYRRGLYTFWKRSLPFPSLSAFDVPSGETACPRRVRSNTPLQALTTLNETTFVEAAQALALRVLKEGGSSDRDRVSFAFQLCTGRRPDSVELRRLLEFCREHRQYFETRSAAAVDVAVPQTRRIPPDVNVHALAAWTMTSRVILNLDETITRE